MGRRCISSRQLAFLIVPSSSYQLRPISQEFTIRVEFFPCSFLFRILEYYPRRGTNCLLEGIYGLSGCKKAVDELEEPDLTDERELQERSKGRGFADNSASFGGAANRSCV